MVNTGRRGLETLGWRGGGSDVSGRAPPALGRAGASGAGASAGGGGEFDGVDPWNTF